MRESTNESFQADVLDQSLPVVVDFWAPWCGPCRALGPTFEALGEEYKDKAQFVKVNVDEASDIASAYGIRGIPTVIVFKAGQVVATKSGAMSKPTLTAFVDSAI